MKFNNMLRAIAMPFKLYPPGESPVKSPNRFRAYTGREGIPPSVIAQTAEAYIKVFCEPPWNENWEEEEVKHKLERELKPPSCLTIMEGNAEVPVGGFCWGKIMSAMDVVDRTIESRRLEDPKTYKVLEKGVRDNIKLEKVLFIDEIAILRGSRGGMSPIQFLFRPVMELSVSEGATGMLGWTSWKSKIAPLATYLGFSIVVAEVEDIVILYNPDIRPLLTIIQNVNGGSLEKIIRTASRLLGRRAA